MGYILITGGTGFLGKALVKSYLEYYNHVIVFSRDEYKQWELKKEIDSNRLTCMVGDIGNPINIDEKIDLIINCAAMKHVSFCDENPDEAIRVNIKGVQNVIKLAKEKEARLIQVSTDKAVAPHNFYGATKMIGEKLVLSAGYDVVRLVNIFGSRGSVVPYFKELKEKGVNTTPVSHIEIRRHFVTLNEAVCEIKEASPGLTIVRGKVIYITDLAQIINPDHQIKIVGMRPGEKIIEDIDIDDKGEHSFYSSEEIKEMLEELE